MSRYLSRCGSGGGSFVPGKNAELLFKTALRKFIIGDRLSPKWTTIKSATENSFRNKLSKKTFGQLANEKNTFVAIELNFNNTNTNIESFARVSWNRFLQYENLDFVYYYIEGKGAIKIERKALKNRFNEYLNNIVKFLK